MLDLFGARCFHCGEVFTPKDDGMQYPDGDYAHSNCHLRQVLGSVAHIEGRCPCYVPGSVEGDPEGMTPRQAADAAIAAWEKKQKQRVQ